jgi:DNA-binding NarL/FixJ family response regulator
MKVLLVDDSMAIQKSFGALLKAVPSVDLVGFAEDVVSALAAIAANPLDLIVLDANLRGRDRGIDVMRYVRQHHSNIEAVMLSQPSQSSVRKSFMDAGALACFDKGVEFQQARDFIAALANTRSAGASELES